MELLRKPGILLLAMAAMVQAVFAVELPKTEEEKKKLSGREIAILRRQMKDREDQAAGAFKNAETAFLVGEYDKAIEEYLAVGKEYNDTSYRMKAVLRVGDVYYRQKRYDRAISYYQRSLKVPSELWWPEESAEDYARADYMIGVCYFDQKSLNRAFAHFRRFVQKFATSTLVDRAYDFIGRGNMEMKRYGQAIEAFKMVGTASLGKQARRTISPGEELYVRVTDADVGLATRNSTVPARVTTSSGDEELIELKALGLGSSTFLGTIKTRLGEPRLTRSLDEAFSKNLRKSIDDWMKTSGDMEEEAKSVENESAQAKKPDKNDDAADQPGAGQKGEDGKEQTAKPAPKEPYEQRLARYESDKARAAERVTNLRTGAAKLRQQAFGEITASFGKIEAILKAWGIKEEDVKAPVKPKAEDGEDEKPKKEANDESEKDEAAKDEGDKEEAKEGEKDNAAEGEEKKAVSLNDVFTQQQISEVRQEAKTKPTAEENYRYRLAVLQYWHETLLEEYKTLDLNGSDTITVEYADLHGATANNQLRKDTLGIASDANIMVVGPDFANIVAAVILGDEVRIKVIDPDMDMTPNPDSVDVVVSNIPKVVTDEAKLETPEPADKDKDKEGKEQDTNSVRFFAEEELEAKMPEMVPQGAPSVTLSLKETGPRTGVFAGSFSSLADNKEGPAAKLGVSPERIIRAAYADKRTSSRSTEWAVVTQVELVPGSSGSHEVIEMQETELDRRSELEKGVALGKLARVYQDLGLKLEAKRAFDEALKVVKKVVDVERGSALGEEATYQMWDLYFASGDEEAAAEACSRLIAAFPNSPLADDALLVMGKAAEKKHPYDALSHYSRLISSYPDSDIAPEAQFRMADIKSKTGTFDVSAFEACANKYPDSNFAAQSLLKLSEYYIENKDFARAKDYLERVTLDFPDFDKLDQVTYMRGICAYRSGDIQLSYTLMHETIEKYPGTSVAKSASKIVELLAKKLKQ